MSPEDRAEFNRQLSGQLQAAAKRGEAGVGYEWDAAARQLRLQTAPIKPKRSAAEKPPSRRGVQGALL